MNKEIEHLDSFSGFYEEGDHMDELMVAREIDIIKRYYVEGKSALEVGCGSGFCTEKLDAIFDDLEVVEPSPKNIEMLKQRLPNIVCHEALLEHFVPDHKYDFIFFLNVIEHVNDPILCLRYLAKLIKHEGMIFITAPNCMSLNRRAGYKMGVLESYDKLAPKDIKVGHRRLYTVDMMKEHCEQAGLKVLDMKGMYLKPLTEGQMIDLGEDVIRAFYLLGEELPEYCASILTIATSKYY
jgi:2-polyprenyl-3-methyl-5-hydroxy-6-metoxy-1,4-benzoquinol methylase